MDLEQRSYCRLCANLTPNSKLFNLLSDTEKCIEVVEKLIRLRYKFINLIRDASLPKTICFLCMDALFKSAAFIEKVEKSQMILKTLFDSNKINKNQSGLDKNDLQSNSYEMLGYTKTENCLALADHTYALPPTESHLQPTATKRTIDFCQKYDLHNSPPNSNNPTELQYVPKKVRKIGYRKKIPQPLTVREINKITDKTWTGYPWTCDICYASFSDVCLLREHTKSVHSKCFAMKCVDCSNTADCFINFVFHARNHRPFLKDICPYCNCNYKTNRKEHIALHYSGPEKICDCCGEIFPNADDLHNHISTYQPPKLNRLSSIARLRPTIIDDRTCDICNKVFTAARSVAAHKKTIHSEKKICYVCGKGFYGKLALSRHRLIHMKKICCKFCRNAFVTYEELASHVCTLPLERPVKCKFCRKAFSTLEKLRSHVRTHPLEKPVKCMICRKAFVTVEELTSHVCTLPLEKPMKCKFCRKAFATLEELRSHVCTLPLEKPLKCKLCRKAFATLEELRSHVHTHPLEKPMKFKFCRKAFATLEELTSHVCTLPLEKPLKCKLCRKAFATLEELRSHVHTHPLEKPMKCKFCRKAFATLEELRSHVCTLPLEKPLKCKLCRKAFATLEELRSHVPTHPLEEPVKCKNNFKLKCNMNENKITLKNEECYECVCDTAKSPFNTFTY